MMKKLFFSCMALLTALAASAQGGPAGVADHLGVSVGVGSTGVTLDLGTMFTDYVGLRVGADLFPGIKVDTDLDLNFDGQAEAAYQTATGRGLPSTIEVQGKPRLGAGHVLADVHPFRSTFRVTLGAYFGSRDVVSVYNRVDGLLRDVYDFNHRRGAFSGVPSSLSPIGVELGDYFLEPDAGGNVEACIRVRSFRPYVGLGFGRAVPKKRLGCQFDLGVQFWGSPEVYLQDHKAVESDFDSDNGDIIKTISKVSVYPSLTIRLVGRIF